LNANKRNPVDQRIPLLVAHLTRITCDCEFSSVKLAPKTKRNLSRILPFGLIWLMCSWVFLLSELGVTRNTNLNPETDVTLTLPILLFANAAILILGLLVGTLEVVYLEKRFRTYSLRGKIAHKLIIYLALFLVVIVITYPLAMSLETGLGVSHPKIWKKLRRFLTSLSFATTLFQLSVSLFVSLIYSAISENLGHHVFLNFFTGKYYRPVVEERVFMFLDMKSSTAIAEALGHVRYFKLLQQYYDLMSNPIIQFHGEVYQYIGDEIVVSWKRDKGLADANCIQCFFAIRDNLEAHQEQFQTEFGVEVGFKAGIHLGEVTIGEVGALKKEIVFTGDVLNTTARIQSLCRELQADLLISGELRELLPPSDFTFEPEGKIPLKGREQQEELFGVSNSTDTHAARVS